MGIVSIGNPSLWFGFLCLIAILLFLDLAVFHRKAHAVGIREALVASVFWILLALIFNIGVWRWFGTQHALEFLTGYLVEKALSVDNIFVFILLFRYFKVPRELHHSVLFFGILGALLMRGIFIFLGAALLQNFHWVSYLFGAILIYTGFKLFKNDQLDVHPEDNYLVSLAKRLFPVTTSYHGRNFFTRIDGTLFATPLFIVLVAVETTDLVFAVDSIPAIFAITSDPFIVFTSNIFAILGLRALYFLLESAMVRLPYLQSGLALILLFIGAKMVGAGLIKIPIGLSLSVIAIILAVSVVASLRSNRKESHAADLL